MQSVIAYLILINALTLLFMRQDKLQAKKHRFRIPEGVLLGLCILGGSLGGVLGMLLFHHKTKKPLFSVGMPVILLIQLGVLLFKFT